jgi:hypothetical protein
MKSETFDLRLNASVNLGATDLEGEMLNKYLQKMQQPISIPQYLSACSACNQSGQEAKLGGPGGEDTEENIHVV